MNQRDFLAQAESLSNLLDKISDLDFENQRIVAELVMVRLFSLLEMHFESITLKVLCNVQYIDSTYPNLIVRSTNAKNAVSNILSYGRTKTWRTVNIKWNQHQCIQENVRYLLNPTDNLLSTFGNHGSVIDEMRRVRNHIAHNTQDTRRKYKSAVVSHYGAYINTITPGKLLLSTRQNPCLLKQYIVTAKIIIKELIKA